MLAIHVMRLLPCTRAITDHRVEDRERLVVVQEIEPRRTDFDVDAAMQAIRRAVAAEHELEVYAAVLAKRREIPKTSSGKTQRSACRERYLSGKLKIVAQWKANAEAAEAETPQPQCAPGPRFVTADEAEGWLIGRIAARLGLTPEQIQVTTPFLEFGMGSVDAVEIAADLERWLGRRMSPTAIYNYPSIAALAQWLANPPHDDEPRVTPHQARNMLADPLPGRLLDDVRNMTVEDIETFIQQEMSK